MEMGLSQADVNMTTPAEDRWHEGEEPLLCRSSLQTTFKHQEEPPLLRCEIVFTMHLYARRPVVCVQILGFCAVQDESRFTMESDS
ncbi:hypothetical protein TNCV_4466571 [Trichonephila clavipes]|nr:hypothetical protein TNCV_4466571 [Trichonephila clavipes]